MTAPLAPNYAAAFAQRTGAVVQWALPLPDETTTPPTLYYTVTVSPGGDTQQIRTGYEAIFFGLTNGTAYSFTVTATNSDGTSVAATTNIIIPPGLPGDLPTIFTNLSQQITMDYTNNALGDPPEMEMGAEFSFEESSPGRIVMFVENESDGGSQFPDALYGNRLGRPAQIGTRGTMIAFECWGAHAPPPTLESWLPSTAYSVGDQVMDPSVTASQPGRWQCLIAGTSGPTDPFTDGPQPYETDTDGSVTWICIGSAAQDARNNYGATEFLFNNLWASLRRIPYSQGDNYHFRSITWAKANGSVDTLGSVATFRIVFRIPLTDYPQATTPWLTAPITPVLLAP